MKKLSCVICTNEKSIEEKIASKLQSFECFDIIEIPKSQSELVGKLSQVKTDVLFIQTEGMPFDTIEAIKMIQKPLFTIAITQHFHNVHKLLYNGFNDYLPNNIDSESFCKVISKIIHIILCTNKSGNDMVAESRKIKDYNIPPKTKPYTFIKYKKASSKINFEEILFIKNVGNYLRIETDNGKIMYHNTTLKKFLSILPENLFTRINKSIIINYEKIDRFEKNTVYMKNMPFTVSRIYANNLKDLIKKSC